MEGRPCLQTACVSFGREKALLCLCWKVEEGSMWLQAHCWKKKEGGREAVSDSDSANSLSQVCIVLPTTKAGGETIQKTILIP